MRPNELVEARASKKSYVKPLLATHGSVQQLTAGGKHDSHGSQDGGSNIKPPIDWKWGNW